MSTLQWMNLETLFPCETDEPTHQFLHNVTETRLMSCSDFHQCEISLCFGGPEQTSHWELKIVTDCRKEQTPPAVCVCVPCSDHDLTFKTKTHC